MLNSIIKYSLENKLVTVLLLIALIAWGIVTAPFGWKVGSFPSEPVPMDANPGIGENNLLIFTNVRNPIQCRKRSVLIVSMGLITATPLI